MEGDGRELQRVALRGYTLDIAAADARRKGRGRGHRPFMGVEEAARRRDFTMNAMMRDALTGALIDPFGGQADIKTGDSACGRENLSVRPAESHPGGAVRGAA